MYMKNFVAANDGNISCKVSEDAIWCTPTGVSKGYMTDDMLVLMDLDGNVLKGNLQALQRGADCTLRVYKENPEKMNAVVHAHPPAATSYAIAGLPLNHAILTEAVMGIGEIPIAPYADARHRGGAQLHRPLCHHPQRLPAGQPWCAGLGQGRHGGVDAHGVH